MSFIDFPISIAFGRSKSPAATLQPAVSGQNLVGLDKKDVAIVCLGIALVFTSLAVLSLAAQR